MNKGVVLVVGARHGSLGWAVLRAAREAGFIGVGAGIQEEEVVCDALADSMDNLEAMMMAVGAQHVVCTVGLNVPGPGPGVDLADWYRWHFETNVTAPMRLLEAFARWTQKDAPLKDPRHFVAISSNSATLPRSSSAAYCASKAALSMALRVKAREGMGGDKGYIVYGYEPGLIAGTPMTAKTARDFPGMPLHRMRGEALASGVQVSSLAAQIVAGLQVPGAALNGVLLRYDGGEQ